jgi:excisionase family DNA binding protein
MTVIEPIALSPRDAAAVLAVSRRTLSDLIRKGKVAARKAGTRTLVDMESLKAYYTSLPVKVGSAPLFGKVTTVKSDRRKRRRRH